MPPTLVDKGKRPAGIAQGQIFPDNLLVFHAFLTDRPLTILVGNEPPLPIHQVGLAGSADGNPFDDLPDPFQRQIGQKDPPNMISGQHRKSDHHKRGLLQRDAQGIGHIDFPRQRLGNHRFPECGTFFLPRIAEPRTDHLGLRRSLLIEEGDADQVLVFFKEENQQLIVLLHGKRAGQRLQPGNNLQFFDGTVQIGGNLFGRLTGPFGMRSEQIVFQIYLIEFHEITIGNHERRQRDQQHDQDQLEHQAPLGTDLLHFFLLRKRTPVIHIASNPRLGVILPETPGIGNSLPSRS